MAIEQYDGRSLKRFNGYSFSIFKEIDKVILQKFPNWNYGQVFTYLYRRFGPPIWGCDDHKQLVSYVLTTNNPNILLDITPSFSSEHGSFHILVEKKLYKKLMDDYKNKIEQRLKTKIFPTELTENESLVLTEITNTFDELLVPVWIRDSLININGHLKNYDYNIKTADYFKHAGIGISHSYFRKYEKNTKT